MRSERLLTRWKGVVLSVIGVVSTLWLAATGRLGLYIHPRYFEFTVILAVIAAVLLVLAFAIVPGSDESDGASVEESDAHGHLHDHAPGHPWRARLAVLGSVAIIVTAAVALLVVPPAALTAGTATQREVNTSAVDTTAVVAAPTGGDYASFSVRDWATLLRSGASEQFLAGTTATVSGFVTPDADDPENVFYVARFVVTCCAVDAQPVGVPIYEPGWADTYTEGQWLEVSGGFAANASVTSAEAVVLEPSSVAEIDEPAMPYVY